MGGGRNRGVEGLAAGTLSPGGWGAGGDPGSAPSTLGQTRMGIYRRFLLSAYKSHPPRPLPAPAQAEARETWTRRSYRAAQKLWG